MPSKTLKAIIVDDEQLSRKTLKECILQFCPEIELVADCNSASTAYLAIHEHHPDLVFLDVEMPKGSGFDLLRMFNPVEFKVIFVTAYSDYAVQSYRYSAVDYLLKPVKLGELIEAVNKVKNELPRQPLPIEVLLENLQTRDDKLKKLVISDSKGFEVINTSDIILCKADTYCTDFFLTGQKKKSCTYNLKHYELILPRDRFMRVHISYIINLDHVKGYTNQGEILLSEDLHCPLSMTHKTGFLRIFRPSK